MMPFGSECCKAPNYLWICFWTMESYTNIVYQSGRVYNAIWFRMFKLVDLFLELYQSQWNFKKLYCS